MPKGQEREVSIQSPRKRPANTMQKQDPPPLRKEPPKEVTKEAPPAASSHSAPTDTISIDADPILQEGEALEPREIPPPGNVEVSPPCFNEVLPATEPKTLAKSIDPDEEPSNLDSDPGGDSDDGALESNSSHATPIQTTRGRKSKKKKHDETSYRDILKGSHKTLKAMMNTRSKQGQASIGATSPK